MDNPDVSPGTVVHVLLLLVGFIALSVTIHVLDRPGLAFALLGLYVAGKFVVAAWLRRRAERASKPVPPLTPPER